MLAALTFPLHLTAFSKPVVGRGAATREQLKVLMSLMDAEQTAWSWPNSSKAPNYLMNMHH